VTKLSSRSVLFFENILETLSKLCFSFFIYA
jgi:hypothetical protein